VLHRIACIVVCLGYSFAGVADQLKIVSAPWEGYTEKDGSGLYFELVKKALGLKDLKFELMPWKRAQAQFERGKFDLLLGESEAIKYCDYPKWAIDADFYSFFAAKDKLAVWPPREDFSKYRFLWVRGYNLDQFDPRLKATSEVNDVEEGMKMIAAGRADALIDYDEDMREKQVKLKISADKFHVVKTNLSGGLIYACFSKSPHAKAQLEAFDKGMESMYKSGEMKTIFTKHNRVKNYETILAKSGKK
jgi:polar amino acid transport system substrate-binding protein